MNDRSELRMSTPGESVESARSEAAADDSGIDAAGYVVPTFAMGVRPGIDLDRARHLASDLADEETVRRRSS
jgi:hypothetical protein